MVRPLRDPIISPDPLIWVRDWALEPDFCEHVVAKFQAEDEDNIYQGKTGFPPRLNPIKSSRDLGIDCHEHWIEEANVFRNTLRVALQEYVNHVQSHIVLPTYDHNNQPTYAQFPMCDGGGISDIVDYGFQIQETQPYNYYDWHEDSLVNYNARHVRLLTYIYYLNDIYEDGCTEFYNGFKVPPRQGRLIIFPATWTYLHRGGILHGTQNKYIATGWMCRDSSREEEFLQQDGEVIEENTELHDEDIDELLYEPPTEGESTLETILQ
tara:strand:- start:932 stop:1732 length:801 start_codon:yes stop_codon:yes gene_type:complete